ncbi:hypothetical protein BCR37DRAFT_265083 [Protomyces lactucae-debilis]|uniref:AA1-like domain-containing protein n=1 Tax=Protomyces lactucae-debilis TaxID=2754530 RepID=A0A1Y2FNS0_PROLT|nr:uncharacterized protein BCR37DRAFT_265083 [Protomyces lactucae-debilis]ORY84365.1 hypothetical protein BCR37DRAFT_265083 [Protomyces lactucae-debilis]
MLILKTSLIMAPLGVLQAVRAWDGTDFYCSEDGINAEKFQGEDLYKVANMHWQISLYEISKNDGDTQADIDFKFQGQMKRGRLICFPIKAPAWVSGRKLLSSDCTVETTGSGKHTKLATGPGGSGSCTEL